jgi:hypothetical protein
MARVFSLYRARKKTINLCFILLLALSPLSHISVRAQTLAAATLAAKPPAPSFRFEQLPVAGGAELLTIFGTLDGLPHKDANHAALEVPLVSVLRDTLGDQTAENDRLRYLWMLTYTRPSFSQQAAAAIPFFYNRVGNKKTASREMPPPPVIDLSNTEHDVWNKIFWTALQNIVLDSYGLPIKLPTRAFRRNVDDYRKAHITRALAVLSLYEATAAKGKRILSDTELRDVQARLLLTEKTFGGMLDDFYLQRVYEKETTRTRDTRGHNWELLRQRAEAEALYFEPLELPDGSATHALLWVARPDLATNKGRKFDSRFLNIANPWRDERLRYWNGYYETRYFDSDNRMVAANTPNAHTVQMIPLALYGLDHPKIPIMLVDFRDRDNPKRREMSRRVLTDVASSVLGLSRFDDVAYFLGRFIYDFVTGRRGMDINQPSRLRSYSQLKLLLSLNASLDPDLRNEVSRRMERVSLNPLENDYDVEAQLARDQYAALVAYARDPAGLPARLLRDRRAEMVPLKHDQTEQTLFKLASILSFGLYTHRETWSPESVSQLDVKRQLAYHERTLCEVARTSPRVEVMWNLEDVRRSLRYIAEHGRAANGETARAVARIFSQTEDEETRTLALNDLYRINNERAKTELLRIYQNQTVEMRWRKMSAGYLRMAAHEEQRITPADAKAISGLGGQGN